MSVQGATVTPLAIAVDGSDHTFVLACVGDCDAGDRLFSRIDPGDVVSFEKRLKSPDAALRLNLLVLSDDGRTGLVGDRVEPDGTSHLLAEVFDAPGNLLFDRTDEENASAAAASFSTGGALIVVGTTTGGSGIAVAFASAGSPRDSRLTMANSSFLCVSSDATGSSSIAGVMSKTGQPAVWRMGATGALLWSFAASAPSPEVALAIDGAGDTALVSRGPLLPAGEEGTVNTLVTTSLSSDGSVQWTAQSAGTGNGDRPLAAAFDQAQQLTVLGHHQFPARFGGGFETIRYDPSGAPLWSRVDDFEQADAEPATFVLDRAADVAAVGNVQSPPATASGFVALYGAAEGALVFSTLDPGQVVGVATDSSGGLLVLGASGNEAEVTRYAAPALDADASASSAAQASR